MEKPKEPLIIKKYANRRLYNTGTSTYARLEDLAEMVKNGEEFVVLDAKTEEDLTRSVLTQIIFELETKGQNLLPISFLRQLIGFYGDSMQSLVPSFLEFSLKSFTEDQEKLRKQMSHTLGTGTLDMIEEQVRKNSEIFQNAVNMFLPFSSSPDTTETKTKPKKEKSQNPELNSLQMQINKLQQQIDKMAEK